MCEPAGFMWDGFWVANLPRHGPFSRLRGILGAEVLLSFSRSSDTGVLLTVLVSNSQFRGDLEGVKTGKSQIAEVDGEIQFGSER